MSDRHRFEAYLDKVFDFSSLVAALPEGRQFPQHPWKKIFDAIFLGAAMQWPSLLQIQDECRTGALAQRIGSISDDTFGYAMQRQSPEPIFDLGCDIARRLKRNGILRSDWSRGLVVAAVDGIEICSSYCRCCDDCLQREVQRKVDGQMRTDIQYYHRVVVVTVVSTPFPIPLGVRFQKQGEGEVACALALLQDLVGQLGRRFVDLLVGDALYLQAPFVQAVGTSANAVKTQVWTALIAMLVLKYLQMKSQFSWSLSTLAALLRQQLFFYRDLWAWLDDPFQAPPALAGVHDDAQQLEFTW